METSRFLKFKKEFLMVVMFVIANLFGVTLWGQNESATDTTVKPSLEERLKSIIKSTDQKTNSKMNTQYVDGQVWRQPEVGDMFVDFTVQQDPKDENSKISLSDYVGRGKYVILDFWASWCTPCIAELEAIRHAYQNLPKDKVVIVSVAVNDRREKSIEAAKKYNIEWEQIIGAGNVPLLAYGFTRIPQIVLFAPDGTILSKDLGGEELLTVTAKYIRYYAPKDHENTVNKLTY